MKKISITYSLIVLCCVVYAFSVLFPQSVQTFGLKPSMVEKGQYYRLVTYAFFHGSVWHIFVNMYSFCYLGSFAESHLSRSAFVLLLTVSIIGGSVAVVFFGGSGVTVGFSGALYGLLGFYITVLVRTGRILNQSIRASVMRNLLVNLMISLMPGVSLFGHLGGFAAGILFGAVHQ